MVIGIGGVGSWVAEALAEVVDWVVVGSGRVAGRRAAAAFRGV
jgi:tRNA A37 threonylcarbamoyladenosine dehydratase